MTKYTNIKKFTVKKACSRKKSRMWLYYPLQVLQKDQKYRVYSYLKGLLGSLV